MSRKKSTKTTKNFLQSAMQAFQQGDLQLADKYCRKAFEIESQRSDALHLSGLVQNAAGNTKQAIELIARAIELNPSNPEFFFNLGVILQQSGEHQLALEQYQAATSLKTDYAEAYDNMGVLYQLYGQNDEALKMHELAGKLSPGLVSVQNNIALAQKNDGHLDEARATLEKILANDPENAQAHYNLSTIHLLQGEFDKGWQEFAWGFSAGERQPSSHNLPEWQGEDLQGKSLLIYAEQGIGDEVMFSSCLPDAIKDADSVILECDPRLVTLFKRTFPEASITGFNRVTGSRDSAEPEADLQCALGSLPGFYRKSENDFPTDTHRLVVDDIRADRFTRQLDKLPEGLKVGISWQGGKDLYTQLRRSVGLEQWLPILQTRGIQFINLQYGDCSESLTMLKEQTGVTVHQLEDMEPLTNLDDFAALVSVLDLVISIDNSTVHFAGSLGIPTWVLTPYIPDWRWQLKRDDNPWYGSVKLYRQRVGTDWSDPVARIAEDLRKLIKKTSDMAADTKIRDNEHTSHHEGVVTGQKKYKCAVITPVGPGHEGLYKQAWNSVETSFNDSPGQFSEIIPIRIDDTQASLGRSQARNIGIRQAKTQGADWIFFLDADDLMSPSAFSNVSPYLDSHDAIWGQIFSFIQGETTATIREGQLPTANCLRDILGVDPFLSIQMGHFVKTDVALGHPFNTEMDTGEDFDYYLRVWKDSKCIKIDVPLFFNRRGAHSQGPRSADGHEWRENVLALFKKYGADVVSSPSANNQSSPGTTLLASILKHGDTVLADSDPGDKLLSACLDIVDTTGNINFIDHDNHKHWQYGSTGKVLANTDIHSYDQLGLEKLDLFIVSDGNNFTQTMSDSGGLLSSFCPFLLVKLSEEQSNVINKYLEGNHYLVTPIEDDSSWVLATPVTSKSQQTDRQEMDMKLAGVKVLISVLTWDAHDYVKNLLHNLEEVTPGSCNYRVQILDQGSESVTRAEVEHFVKDNNNAHAEYLDSNIGFAAGHNHNFSTTWPEWNFDYLVVLNSDVVIDEANWLDKLVLLMENNPQLGIAGPHALNVITEPENQRGHGRPATDEEIGRGAFTFISGCLSIIRCTAINELGLYDEHFTPGYFEDADLSCRYRTNGYALAYIPIAFKHHYLGQENSTAKQKRQQLIEQFGDFMERNRQLFNARWLKTARSNNEAFVEEPELENDELVFKGPLRGEFNGYTIDMGPDCELRIHKSAQVRSHTHFEIYDGGHVTLGEKCVIGMFNWLQGNGDIVIGANTLLGPHVTLLSTMHGIDAGMPVRDQPLRKKHLVIGNDVFIGANSTIAAGVELKDSCVIASNSYVGNDVEAYTIVGGVPARFIKKREVPERQLRSLAVVAVGNSDRPNRFNTHTNMYVTIGNALLDHGVDSWYICHPQSAGDSSRIPEGRQVLRENHDDFATLLDEIRPDWIYIWNGASNGDEVTASYARERNIPVIYSELGWFSQSDTIYFDFLGTNARSSLRKLDLDTITASPELDSWIKDYLDSRPYTKTNESDFFFVPLQDETDVNITLNSPYKTMNEMVAALAEKYPGERFIVRPHPRYPDVHIEPRDNIEVRTDGDLYGWLDAATAVIGINSTVLLEALLFNKNVFSLGEGLGSGLGIFHEGNSVNELELHQQVADEQIDKRRRFLSELIFSRQAERRLLGHADYLLNRTLIGHMINTAKTNTSKKLQEVRHA